MNDHTSGNEDAAREKRLDELQAEASGMSQPQMNVSQPRMKIRGPSSAADANLEKRRGYYGQPVLKPPVWTWEVPVYFFIGGMAGMAAVIALACLAAGGPAALVRSALWLAAGGAAVSPVLLALDLGRPRRFLFMLRVFKRQSPMSVGAWTLVAFGLTSVPSALLFEYAAWGSSPATLSSRAAAYLADAALVLAAPLGALLATYTGVLLGATAIPAWSLHSRTLPLHFGLAGLGSAAAALELLGHRSASLNALGLGAAALESAVGLWIEVHRHGAKDRALREGRSGLLMRGSGILAGPLALVLRLIGLRSAAAVSFLLGALLSRFGWVQAGRASAFDPAAVFETSAGEA